MSDAASNDAASNDAASNDAVTNDAATKIETLRKKAIAARARVAQIDALHLDLETLEEQLFTVGPTEAAQIRQSERQITLQVAAATEKAEEAEAEFEIAMLEHGYGLN
jgi:hypothetical protein